MRQANPLSFPQQWRPLRLVQHEHREQTDELWRRLDDLVTDASDFPSTLEPCALLALSPRLSPQPRPCSGDIVQNSMASLMGVVFGYRADGAANQRSPPSTGARVWADACRARGSSDYTDAQADGAGCVGASLHDAGDGAG